MDSDRFDVEAKADCSRGPVAYDQMQLMIQSMLESRFQLKAHYESQEAPIYNLVVAKDGPKMKLSEDQTPARPVGPPPPPLCGPPPTAPVPDGQRGIPFDPRGPLPRAAGEFREGPSGSTFTAAAVPLSALINTLRQSAGRPVVDKTVLTGLFDIQLQKARGFNPGFLLIKSGGDETGTRDFRRDLKFNRTDPLKKRLWSPLSWIDPKGVVPLILKIALDGTGWLKMLVASIRIVNAFDSPTLNRLPKLPSKVQVPGNSITF